MKDRDESHTGRRLWTRLSAIGKTLSQVQLTDVCVWTTFSLSFGREETGFSRTHTITLIVSDAGHNLTSKKGKCIRLVAKTKKRKDVREAVTGEERGTSDGKRGSCFPESLAVRGEFLQLHTLRVLGSV